MKKLQFKNKIKHRILHKAPIPAILPISSTILYILSALSLTTLSTNYSASALTYQDNADIDFTLNPTINVTLSSSDLIIDNLAPGSASDSNIITVDVSTNAGWGYYLSATANTSGSNTNLTYETSDTNIFTSLNSNKPTLSDFSDNTWGYSYSTDDGTTWVSGDIGSATTGYNGLPLDNNDSGSTGIKLLNPNSYASSGSIQFKIGAKAGNTQAAGTYTGTINFYAVTTPSPTTFDDAFAAASKEKLLGYYKMQDMTTSICQNVEQGLNTKLIDIRDNETYTIAKLKDDNCWMLDNLALDLTNGNVQSNMYNSTNTKTNASYETLGYLFNGGGSTDSDSELYKYAVTAIINWGSVSGKYSIPMTNLSNKDRIPADTISQSGIYKVGGYYNYCAASAGGYCYGDNAEAGTSEGNATEDICPTGWRMPTGGSNGEYEALYKNNYNSFTKIRTALHLPLSGGYNSQILNIDTSAIFWSSTRASDSKMYDLNIILEQNDIGSVYPGSSNTRKIGRSVRCLAK